jgi:membrane protease YdiL (CAAX protease family)
VSTVIEAVVVGMIVMLAGTLPWHFLLLGNLRFLTGVPWAVPIAAAYIGFYWHYLRTTRPEGLRANRLTGNLWTWSLIAGGLGVVALVLALRLANRLVVLPEQTLPSELTDLPALTIVPLLLVSAPIAGVVEEASFRGYMQGPIEARYGIVPAILITGTMFAVAHLDFTLMLWPYYVAVAAIYGLVTYLTNSTLPAIVLHTSGNLYSNFDLLLHGRAEWQAPSAGTTLIWDAGPDRSFWILAAALLVVTGLAVCAYVKLARAAKGIRPPTQPAVVERSFS